MSEGADSLIGIQVGPAPFVGEGVDTVLDLHGPRGQRRLVSTPGLERMARFMAFLAEEVSRAPGDEINPTSGSR